MRLCAMTVLACWALAAQATGNFYCAGKTETSSVALGANVDADGEIIFPPRGHVRLSLEGVDVDNQRIVVTREGPWTTLRDRDDGGLLFSYRRTTSKPRFVAGVAYEFCSAQSWRGICWGARARHTDGKGRVRQIDAVCGSG
jgi:hypothetical protein